MTYKIVYSEDAREDYAELYKCIALEYRASLTAFRYMQGIIDTIRRLEKMPAAYPIKTNISLLKYGFEVRRLNYKKMAIIYTVHDDVGVVFIHRIVASNMITGL
jgi:plasmid stabilization system protein ParE